MTIAAPLRIARPMSFILILLLVGCAAPSQAPYRVIDITNAGGQAP